MSAVERSAIRKVYLRLLPFGCLWMIVCYLDRINVGFAALTMRGDLALSATAFGFGAVFSTPGTAHSKSRAT